MDLLTFLEDTNFDDFIKKYFGGDAISFIKFLDSKNLLDEFMDKFENEGYFTVSSFCKIVCNLPNK